MNSTQIIQELTDIFRDQLDNPEVTLEPETTAADVEGWDSLTHMQLVVAVEKHFKVRFLSSEIAAFRNIGDMVQTLLKRLGP